MNYFLETEVKPIQVDNGLSLHQRYQSMRYRAIRFPGSEQASARPAALDTRFGNAPNTASPHGRRIAWPSQCPLGYPAVH